MPHKDKNARIEYAKQYYLLNKRKQVAQRKLNYKMHCRHYKNKAKEFRENNPDIIKERKLQYRIKSAEKIKEYNRLYFRNKRKDINYRILLNLRKRLGSTVKCKVNKTVDLLGCTINQLRTHLEGLFTNGMSWSNYGKHGWHIDHIRPCASFDLTDPFQQKQCFHYTNLQPLWAFDNLSKGARLQKV
jgi:hypothetical protein